MKVKTLLCICALLFSLAVAAQSPQPERYPKREFRAAWIQAVNGGAVGAQYNISNRVGIYVEPGVSYFFDDGSPIETIRKENPTNFTLQAGIRLTY